jgi:hypothetical protein
VLDLRRGFQGRLRRVFASANGGDELLLGLGRGLGDAGGRRQGDLALAGDRHQRRCALTLDHLGPVHAALGDVQQLLDLGARYRNLSIWRGFRAPTLGRQVCQPSGDHRALCVREVPAVEVVADDVDRDVVAGVAGLLHVDAERLAGARPVPAVDQLALGVEHDRLHLPVRADVLHESGELAALNQREDVSHRVDPVVDDVTVDDLARRSVDDGAHASSRESYQWFRSEPLTR